MVKSFFSVIALISAMSPAVATDANVTVVDVFAPGESGVAAYRIPGILAIPDTTMRAASRELRSAHNVPTILSVHGAPWQ